MTFTSVNNINSIFSKTQLTWDSFSFFDFNNIFTFNFTTNSLYLNNFSLYSFNIYFLYAGLFLLSLFYLFKSNFFFKTLTLCEEEINASDDFLVILYIVLLFFFFNFYGIFCFSYFSTFNVFVNLFILLFISLILLPLTALYNFGYYFIINIKGSGSSLSFFYELVQDNINLLSFFLRVYIQLVRLITITVTYFGYNHLVLSYNFTSTEFSLNSSVIVLIRFLFELVHTIIIFIAQMLSLMIMILWLFQFLFTVFVNKSMEISPKL